MIDVLPRLKALSLPTFSAIFVGLCPGEHVVAGRELSHPADVAVSHLPKQIHLPPRGFPPDRGGSQKSRHTRWKWPDRRWAPTGKGRCEWRAVLAIGRWQCSLLFSHRGTFQVIGLRNGARQAAWQSLRQPRAAIRKLRQRSALWTLCFGQVDRRFSSSAEFGASQQCRVPIAPRLPGRCQRR